MGLEAHLQASHGDEALLLHGGEADLVLNLQWAVPFSDGHHKIRPRWVTVVVGGRILANKVRLGRLGELPGQAIRSVGLRQLAAWRHRLD